MQPTSIEADKIYLEMTLKEKKTAQKAQGNEAIGSAAT